MIRHRWYDEVPADLAAELDDLIADAASYDAEAGFSTARPSAPAPAGADTRHLLVSMPPKGSRGSVELDALPDANVVAYLRLEVADGIGDTQLLVRREFRSLGVATLLFEKLDELPDGWTAVTGLREIRGWSHGGHPAAERLSRRFDARETRGLFKTLCPLGGRTPFAPPDGLAQPTVHPIGDVAEAAPGHDAAMAPADRATRERFVSELRLAGGNRAAVGRAAEGERSSPAPIQVERAAENDAADKDDVTVLLAAALVDAQQSGARVAQLYVDTGDDVLLHVSRELGFFHDQSDRVFALTLPS